MSWRALPDLAVRTRGGSVVAANDETFGEKENLIRAAEPAFQPHTYGHHGQIMDGWETRRRREPGHASSNGDWAIVRLGLPGIVRGVVVDTAWFTGNFPPECSVEAACLDLLGTPMGSGELVGPSVEWDEIVPRSTVRGDSTNAFDVDHNRLVTHVRLRQFPDGGVARLRVHGEPLGDPRWVAGRSFDLAAMEHGARVAECSNRFYSTPDNLLAPGPARVMGEGWETSRRRDERNDWVVVVLAAHGVVRQVEIDTSCFIGNAPGEASLSGLGAGQVELLPRVRLQPDTVNRFLPAADNPVSRLRLDIYPDGGVARLRAFGEPSHAGRTALFLRWYDRLTPDTAGLALTGWGGADESWARGLAAGRPYADAAHLGAVAAELPGIAPDGPAWAALTGVAR
jgi:allantoicase